MDPWLQFEARKRDHIREALRETHQARSDSVLDSIHLFHDALPELDFDEIDLKSEVLGTFQKTPFFIAGMTAGHPDAHSINSTLARACEDRGWVFGLGSQRRDFTSSEGIENWAEFREAFPRLKILANLGVTQLPTLSLDRVERLFSYLKPDALVLHLNPLQETLQTEGTPDFSGLVEEIKNLSQEMELPLLLKETGSGFSRKTLNKLKGIRLHAIDVSGLGGTHWGRIEGARAPEQSLNAEASKTFAHWGETTVDSVLMAREVLPSVRVWASGGVRSGLDAARLIALGADAVGYAKPALEASMSGSQSLLAWMEKQEHELKIALFCTGNRTPRDLRGAEAAWTRKTS